MVFLLTARKPNEPHLATLVRVSSWTSGLMSPGSRGIGIETGWSANGTEISGNNISMSTGSTGIIATGFGVSGDKIQIQDNIILNTSSAGPQSNDLRTQGFSTSREVGLLVSSDKITSRTGDAGGALQSVISGNRISGFTNAVAGIKGTAIFDAQLTRNSIAATSTAVLYGTLSGATFVPAPIDGMIPRWIIPENWWGSATIDENQLISGWVSISPWCLTAECTTFSPG